jgi:hypothetical protein
MPILLTFGFTLGFPDFFRATSDLFDVHGHLSSAENEPTTLLRESSCAVSRLPIAAAKRSERHSRADRNSLAVILPPLNSEQALTEPRLERC